MTMTRSLERIDGIGPRTRDLFRAGGLSEVGDLVFHSVDALHGMVGAVASREEVIAWQRIALLMQVEGVDLTMAAALHEDGVESVGELGRQSLADLSERLDRAKAAGRIDLVPSADACCAIIRDATVIDLTASLAGRVLDPDGHPVEGVEVIAAALSATTNAQGYFRLVRVPVGPPVALVFRYPDFETLIVEEPDAALANEVVLSEDYAFARPARAAGGGVAERLSELDGDAMPPAGAFRMATVNGTFADIREGDVLRVARFYERDPDARLVSRLKAFQDGEVLVSVFKVPRDRLPRSAKVGDLLQLTDGKLVEIDWSEQQLLAWLLVRRAIKEAGQDGATPDEGRLLDVAERHAALMTAYGQGILTGKSKP